MYKVATRSIERRCRQAIQLTAEKVQWIFEEWGVRMRQWHLHQSLLAWCQHLAKHDVLDLSNSVIQICSRCPIKSSKVLYSHVQANLQIFFNFRILSGYLLSKNLVINVCRWILNKKDDLRYRQTMANVSWHSQLVIGHVNVQNMDKYLK